MKYDKETTDNIVSAYHDLIAKGTPKIGVISELCTRFSVPSRSLIAKLSSMGIYKRGDYTDKRGELPVKKEEYIERIAAAMEVNIEILDSLEKCNKNVLILIEKALKGE